VKKIKVGVVGVGYFGRFHAEKYAGMDQADLVGISDVDLSRAEDVARRCRTRPFSQYTDLIGHVQAVSITVPTRLHYPVAADFLNHGVDVLIEKPITSTVEEADRLIRLAEERSLILQVGHLERFNGALLASREYIRNPLLFESRRLSPFLGRGADVDVVLDLMIHDIDVLLSLVSSEVSAVHATGNPVVTSQLDTAVVRIEFENGCVARLEASRVADEKARKTLIHQEEGVITIDYLSQKAFLSRPGTLPDAAGSIPPLEEISVHKADLVEAEILSFLQSVRDRQPPPVSGRDGKRALEMALRIVESAAERNRNLENRENIKR
jgi:predicted dehydrogenase